MKTLLVIAFVGFVTSAFAADRYVVVSGAGDVVNAILLEDPAKWKPPAGHTLVRHEAAGVGWRYVKGKFTAPARPADPPAPPPRPVRERLDGMLKAHGLTIPDLKAELAK